MLLVFPNERENYGGKFEKPHLCVLLHQFREVIKHAVLGPEEIKCIVSGFLVHQVGQELPSVASHKLCRQLDDVAVEKEIDDDRLEKD